MPFIAQACSCHPVCSKTHSERGRPPTGWGQGLRADQESLELQRPSTPHSSRGELSSATPQPTALSQAVSPSASLAAWATALVLPPWLRVEETAPFSALSILPGPPPPRGGATPALLSSTEDVVGSWTQSLDTLPVCQIEPHYSMYFQDADLQ